MCSVNWGWCSTYCQQLYFSPNLEKIFYIYLFDSRSKDENSNLSSSGTTVLPKFHTMYSLKNYVRSIYYNTKHVVKKRYHDKSESIIQYRKEKYLKNRTSKITYQKAKYQENPEVQLAYKKCKYQENAEHKKNKKIRYQKCQEKKKSCDKVENFLQQVKQGPYYICTICHESVYQCSVRFLKHEKYRILTSELYHPVKSFDEKLYIYENMS